MAYNILVGDFEIRVAYLAIVGYILFSLSALCIVWNCFQERTGLNALKLAPNLNWRNFDPSMAGKFDADVNIKITELEVRSHLNEQPHAHARPDDDHALELLFANIALANVNPLQQLALSHSFHRERNGTQAHTSAAMTIETHHMFHRDCGGEPGGRYCGYLARILRVQAKSENAGKYEDKWCRTALPRSGVSQMVLMFGHYSRMATKTRTKTQGIVKSLDDILLRLTGALHDEEEEDYHAKHEKACDDVQAIVADLVDMLNQQLNDVAKAWRFTACARMFADQKAAYNTVRDASQAAYDGEGGDIYLGERLLHNESVGALCSLNTAALKTERIIEDVQARAKNNGLLSGSL